MSYGQAERREITAQFVLAALIVIQKNANNIPFLARTAWDVAEIFEQESKKRYKQIRENERTNERDEYDT